MLRIEDAGRTSWFVAGRGLIGSFVVVGSLRSEVVALAVDGMVAAWRLAWADYRECGGRRPPDVLLDVRSGPVISIGRGLGRAENGSYGFNTSESEAGSAA